MAMKLHQRSFALIMAVLFLGASLGFSFIVIAELMGDDTQDTGQVDTSQQADEASQGSEETENTQANNEGGDMLQGTQLANFDPINEQAKELQTIDLEEGSGQVVQKGDSITAHYTGAYATTGEIFESSKDSGSPFTANLITPDEAEDGRGLIEGWVEGLQGMKVGGTRRLVIPGNLAYGEAPEGYVPGEGGRPLGTLVFDIEVLGIE